MFVTKYWVHYISTKAWLISKFTMPSFLTSLTNVFSQSFTRINCVLMVMHSSLWPIWSVLSISPEFLVLCSVGILSVNWPRRPASYSVLFPLEKPLIWEMTFINVSSSNFSWRWFLARCGDHICSIWLPPAELGRIEASQEGWRGAQWFQRAKIRRKWVHFREFFRAIC